MAEDVIEIQGVHFGFNTPASGVDGAAGTSGGPDVSIEIQGLRIRAYFRVTDNKYAFGYQNSGSHDADVELQGYRIALTDSGERDTIGGVINKVYLFAIDSFSAPTASVEIEGYRMGLVPIGDGAFRIAASTIASVGDKFIEAMKDSVHWTIHLVATDISSSYASEGSLYFASPIPVQPVEVYLSSSSTNPLTQVSTKGAVVLGTWWYDSVNGRIYVADNPNGIPVTGGSLWLNPNQMQTIGGVANRVWRIGYANIPA
jgi:hypothetical protein